MALTDVVGEVNGTTFWELVYSALRVDRATALFKGLKASNLLDIGCGCGTVTTRIREILELDLVDGVDLLADKLKVPSWLKTVKVDLDKEDLPYSDSVYEAIFCGELIEHVYDPDHLLDEIYRVLAPNGVCILTTPNLASWPNRLILPLGFQPFSTSASLRYEQVGKFKMVGVQGHRGHIRVFTLKALKELLALHGFEIVKLEGWAVGDLSIHLHSSLLGKLVKPVDEFFAKFPSLASRVAVVIRRSSEN